MLEDLVRSPRRPQESTDLHRWAMLRMAINEDKCCTLVNMVKKNKKGKNSGSMSALFKDLPTLAAVRTWKTNVGGDVRLRYGGDTDWDSGLTDSAYLMYGIPRATLKHDHLIKLKQRHLRKKVTPRSINYSQSFSDYGSVGEVAISSEPGDRHSTAGHSIESSVSSLSSTPSSPGSPISPISPRVPHHLPPNSVSVLPRNNPKLVNLHHVELKPNPETSRSSESKVEIHQDELRHNRSPLPPVEPPKTGTRQNGQVPSPPDRPKTTSEVNDNKNNNSNKSSTAELTVTYGNSASSSQTTSLSQVEPSENHSSSYQNTRVTSLTGVNNNNVDRNLHNDANNNSNGTKNTEASDSVSRPSMIPPPPAPPPPKLPVPIHKRPPHPAPKPKKKDGAARSYNMAPLHAALIGSLQKRLKSPVLKSPPV